jgi:hypothetical protein
MRRPALTARIRRSARVGHRSALREPEGSFRPDRSPWPPRARRPAPVQAIPLAPRRGRSRSGNPEAAAQRVRSRSPVHTRRASRSAELRRARRLGSPRLPRRDPKVAPHRACSPSRSTEYLSNDGSRRPAQLLRNPKTAPKPVRLPAEADRVSAPTELRRARRSQDPAGCPSKPESSVGLPAGALCARAEAPPFRAPPFAPSETRRPSGSRLPFEDRSPLRSDATRPSSRWHLPSLAFVSGTEAPSTPTRPIRNRCLTRTERAVEMAPRASSPTGVCSPQRSATAYRLFRPRRSA